MAERDEWQPRGILDRKAGEAKFRLARHLASPGLAYFIEQYWIVYWDLRGQPSQRQETLPHPTIHLVFEKDNSLLFGVPTGKFVRQLEGQGMVFGIKFRPGGFYPFVKRPVADFTGKRIPAEKIFGPESREVETTLVALQDEARMLEVAEDFLRKQAPAPDENIELLDQIFERITDDRSIIKVEDLAEQIDFSQRTLQRLFSQYVGVSPKWVIKRYRLHEAAEQLAAGNAADLAKMAVDLGYFDQAHFIKDFKTLVGRTPAEYARQNEPG